MVNTLHESIVRCLLHNPFWWQVRTGHGTSWQFSTCQENTVFSHMGANPNGKLAEHNNALMLISPLAEDNWMLKRGGYHNHYFFCPCSAANNNPRGTHPHLVGFFLPWISFRSRNTQFCWTRLRHPRTGTPNNPSDYVSRHLGHQSHIETNNWL